MYNAKIDQEIGYRGTKSNTWCHRIEYTYRSTDGNWVFSHVIGKATCSPTDKYNEEFGRNLAKTKAHEAYWHEVKKLQIAETYRPEWKKKQKMSFEGKTAHLYGIDGFEITKDINRIGKEMAKKFGKGKSVKVTIEEI